MVTRAAAETVVLAGPAPLPGPTLSNSPVIERSKRVAIAALKTWLQDLVARRGCKTWLIETQAALRRVRLRTSSPQAKPTFAKTMAMSASARHVCAGDGARLSLSRRSFAGVRDDVQTGRPKTVRPALALADFGSKPGPVVINTLLRTEALERSTMPYQAELAMAVSAMIFHSFLPEWHLG